MHIKGIHHVSAHTASAQQNYQFYTEVLGMRLVKKTVNQDEPSMYHLFYGDALGKPGTELTFFEIPQLGRTYRGTNSISNVSLRVPNDEALHYWQTRFNEFGVKHEGIQERAGHQVIPFEDFETQRLTLISDENNEGVRAGIAWEKSPVESRYGIIGLGPVRLTVRRQSSTVKVLRDILKFKQVGAYEHDKNQVVIFSTGEGGNGAEIHVEEKHDSQMERPGRGSVHHVALRVEDEAQMRKWLNHLDAFGILNSGIIDRHYFHALYFRDMNGILFELSTDGPGFAVDEDIEHLGERLALPPFLESKRNQIEQSLTPLYTIK